MDDHHPVVSKMTNHAFNTEKLAKWLNSEAADKHDGKIVRLVDDMSRKLGEKVSNSPIAAYARQKGSKIEKPNISSHLVIRLARYRGMPIDDVVTWLEVQGWPKSAGSQVDALQRRVESVERRLNALEQGQGRGEAKTKLNTIAPFSPAVIALREEMYASGVDWQAKEGQEEIKSAIAKIPKGLGGDAMKLEVTEVLLGFRNLEIAHLPAIARVLSQVTRPLKWTQADVAELIAESQTESSEASVRE